MDNVFITFHLHARSIYCNKMSFCFSFLPLNPKCLSVLPRHISKCALNPWAVQRQTLSFCVLKTCSLTEELFHCRSHYLKSSALKQKVRDQQILTSGQAYVSILMQFLFSNSPDYHTPACQPDISSVWVWMLRLYSRSYKLFSFCKNNL